MTSYFFTPRVKIYTSPSCLYCRIAKKFLEQNSIAYDEFDLVSDLGLRQEIFEKVGEIGVPVIEVGDEIFVGFDSEGLKRTLNLA